jgi:hypothetical protein
LNGTLFFSRDLLPPDLGAATAAIGLINMAKDRKPAKKARAKLSEELGDCFMITAKYKFGAGRRGAAG